MGAHSSVEPLPRRSVDGDQQAVVELELQLVPGDRVTAIGGTAIETWADMVKQVGSHVSSSPEAPLKVQVIRGEDTLTLESELTVLRYGQLGVQISQLQFEKQEGVLSACVIGTERAFVWGKRIFVMVKALLSREVSAKNLVVGSLVAPVWPPTGGGSAMGSDEERQSFLTQVTKACRIARDLREIGIRPYGIVRIDSALTG